VEFLSVIYSGFLDRLGFQNLGKLMQFDSFRLLEMSRLARCRFVRQNIGNLHDVKSTFEMYEASILYLASAIVIGF
jgi:hypothetical protein